MQRKTSGPFGIGQRVHRYRFIRGLVHGAAGIGLVALLTACGAAAGDRLGLYGSQDFGHLDVTYEVVGLQDTYEPGASGEVKITIRLEEIAEPKDGPRYPRQAVAFLNVVKEKEKEKVDENGNKEKEVVQVAHELFRQANPRPMIFRAPRPAAHYVNGLTTTLRFRISNNAADGEYFLVLQLFPGTNTNPHRVDKDQRIGGVGVRRFEITD